MGRSSGLGNIIDSVAGGGTLRGKGRVSGIPMPFTPTENIGIMSGAIRKKGEGRRDERGSRRGVKGGMMQVTMRDRKTGKMYGGLVKDGVPQFKAPDGSTPQGYPAIRPDGKGIKEPPPGFKYDEIDRLVPIDTPPIRTPKPTFDPSKPSAVQETTRVNVQDPTLGIDKAEMRDRQEARRDEAMMRDSEMGGRRRGRRDFTRRRPERRRSREERAAFRDRYVSTLGSNFFS